MRIRAVAALAMALCGVSLHAQPAAWWQGAEPGENSWLHLDWFGWFRLSGAGPFFHHEHGWLSTPATSAASLPMHNATLDSWLWTSAAAYPNVYVFGVNPGWYAYQTGGRPGSRVFYNYARQELWEEYRIILPPPPAGFAVIPAGTFTMGSPAGEPGRGADEAQHAVTIRRLFYLQRTEVTWELWNTVRDWALQNGYTDLPAGRNGYDGDPPGEVAGQRPVTEIDWHTALKWCNARSEMEQLQPCYLTGSGQVYRTGKMVPSWNRRAYGYRLPTEAEWERACRGGTDTALYLGRITATGSQEDPNLVRMAWYFYNTSKPQPVGQLEPNAWGLLDMGGNVREWCWDGYGPYAGDAVDPTGRDSATGRVLRGGSWADPAASCRSASRASGNPATVGTENGFRPALGRLR